MDIRIKATSFEMTRETADYLDKKLNDVEEFLDEKDEAARCEVEVGRAVGRPERGNIWKAEINLLYKGMAHRAEATAESVNYAIDVAKDDLLQQLRRAKKLHVRLARRGGALLKRIIRFGDGE